MKNIILILILLFNFSVTAQVADYNQFPSMQPQHILDENLESISFAYSLRILESNYVGPLIRLRRDSDDAEQDFYCRYDDKVDIEAINAWRTTANVFVTVWYDQSGLNLNAEQASNTNQPQFYPDAIYPYFKGDGVNDRLTIDTPNGLQDVTNNGAEATISTIMMASKISQNSFGVTAGTNRWSCHGNWSNNNLFFDPGPCCNSPRNFDNTTNENKWANYTLIRTDTGVIGRANNIEKFNGAHTKGRCDLTYDFSIGWATTTSDFGHSTTSFLEFIMYKTDIDSSIYEAIEENQTLFWNL